MGKHKSSDQEDLFVAFMKENPDLAKGYIKGDRVTAEAKWLQLVERLNAKGPPIKDICGWKKVWSDWKIHIRKKLAKNKCEAKATGGGPYAQHVILPIKETIATICGLFEMVDGVGASTFGVPAETKTRKTDDIVDLQNEEFENIEPNKNSLVGQSQEDDPSFSKRRRVVKENAVPSDLSGICAAQMETLEKINKNLETMSAQQAEHFKRMEEIEREKLEVAKKIAEAIGNK